MKNFLLTFVLGIIITCVSYPQSGTSDLRGSELYRFKQIETSLPIYFPTTHSGQVQGDLRLLNNKKLNKNEKNLEVSGITYKPIKVIADSLYKNTITYDDKGNQLIFLIENWLNETWVNSSRSTYTYDKNGKPLTYLWETYKNGAWSKGVWQEHTYDNNGNELTGYYEVWNADTLSLCNRNTFNYDKTLNQALCLNEVSTNGLWVNNSRFTYKYDINGNLVEASSEIWENEVWKVLGKETFVYNTDGKVITRTSYYWENGTWFTRYVDTYTYDSYGHELTHNGTVTHTYDGRGNELTFTQVDMKHTYTYDNNDYRITDTYEVYRNNVWEKVSKLNFTNNNHGIPVKVEGFIWKENAWQKGKVPGIIVVKVNDENWGFLSASVLELEYVSFTGMGNTASVVQQFNLSQNYPNPFNPLTKIDYSIKKAGDVKLSVYDALGKMVAVVVDEFKPTGSYSVKFDGHSLPSGVYLYRLESGQDHASRKFILIK